MLVSYWNSYHPVIIVWGSYWPENTQNIISNKQNFFFLEWTVFKVQPHCAILPIFQARSSWSILNEPWWLKIGILLNVRSLLLVFFHYLQNSETYKTIRTHGKTYLWNLTCTVIIKSFVLKMKRISKFDRASCKQNIHTRPTDMHNRLSILKGSWIW